MKLAILCALVAAVAAFPAPENIDWTGDVIPIEEHPEFLARYPIYKTLFPEGQASGSNRIVGGAVATAHQFPYQTALLLQMTGGLALCGGSVISANFVLTAAHCTDNIANVQVIMGARDRTVVEPTQVRQTVLSANVINHPQWTPSNLNNDISLIRLNTPVGFTAAIAAIAMPTRAQVGNTFVGETANVSGFGRTSDASGATSAVVMFVTVPVITNAACAAVYGGAVIVGSTICVSTEGGRGTCGGDSGGPLTLNGAQIGVVSFGAAAGCQLGFPAGFARVTSFLDFIQNNSDLTIS